MLNATMTSSRRLITRLAVVSIALAAAMVGTSCRSDDTASSDASAKPSDGETLQFLDLSLPVDAAASVGDGANPDNGVLAKSCLELRYAGVTADGSYQIDPTGGSPDDAITTFCDMQTDGGGWTAIVANGEIAADETTASSDCYPLISNDPAAGCGPTGDLFADFTMSGGQQAALAWRYLLAVAYDDTGYANKLAYFAIDFGSAEPTTASRIGGTPYPIAGLTTTYGEIHCTNQGGTERIVHYETAGMHNPDAAGVAKGRGTIFGHDSASSMDATGRETFGFTDAALSGTSPETTSLKGIDDYQDGWSCGDSWVPQEVRGRRLVVLVR